MRRRRSADGGRRRRAVQGVRKVWASGWYRPARRIPSPNFGPRPAGVEVTLVVLHSISLPPGEYGTDAVTRLFTNRLDPRAHPAFAALEGLQVSAHFVIRREGRCEQYVSCDDRAWHAGVSSWQGRAQCNDYSVGIELEGLEGERFEGRQYRRLARLLTDLRKRYRVCNVAGHEHVAPGRKRDPGPGFDWARLVRDVGWPASMFASRDSAH